MRKKGIKRLIAYVCAVCMLVAGLFVTDCSTIQVKAAENTTIYFLNSDEWAEVGAYIYGEQGELLGGWGTTTAEPATELGGNWMKVTATGTPPCSIIFYNKANDSERAELYLPTAENIYVTAKAQSFTSREEAEASLAASALASTKVYFYNSEGWTTVNAYVWGTSNDSALPGWPGVTAAESEIGEKWMELEVPADPAFHVIFFNAENDAERVDAYIENKTNVYATMTANYASALEAEIAFGDATGVNLYFLNSGKWAEVGAYIYGDKGALLGEWGDTTAVAAGELGADWVKVTVSEAPPYSVIFYNKANDSERAELYLPAAENLFVTATAQSYTSKEAAEQALGDTSTVIYFLNYDGEAAKFEEVYAYAYANDAPVAAGWPGVKATQATDLGGNWWQAELPVNAMLTPFTVIFNDGAGNQLADINISNYENNYITAKNDATLYTSQADAERSVGIVNETVVYYLNSKGWENVAAYVYGDAGQVLGGWPGADTEAAPELGEHWVKATVPAKPKFNIIFHEKSDTTESIRAELLIQTDKQVYVAGCKEDGNVAAYGSLEEAELAMGMGDPDKMATLYFYNSRGWGDINGYVYREEDGVGITVGSGWPGKAAEAAPEVGENWWKVTVPRIPSQENPFFIIFNDGVNQTEDILIDETENVYITVAGGTYATATEAEEAAANDVYDDGCEEGPNADLDGYTVSYDGAGAVLPYVTYEAEAAVTNAEVLEKAFAYRETIQSEAGGRQAVKLKTEGDYVEFTLTEAANSLVLRYCMPDNADGSGTEAGLSMYVNGTELQDLALTSKYAWVYGGYPFNNNPANGMAHRFFDETRVFLGETLPAGTTIRLQKDADDMAEYYIVDFIECELVGAPLEQPENSLSVTDFGAVANDGLDDRDAFVACIAAAREQGKEVWIPAGSFDLVEKEALVAAGVTIRGAGMWYTNLNGAGAAFKYEGTSKFFDFAINGVSTVRDDSGDLAGFEGNGKRATNLTIQNIWMEHIKVGVWSANTDGMVVQGCRIRNTYADGINLCSGTTNATVRNNSLRNTGDDGIAIWPWLADCSGNTIAHNTVQIPTLANGIAIYGGGNNVVDNNYVADTINNGAGIVTGSEFDTAKGYVGPITIQNNVLDRCGSMQTDENYQIGAIWVWSSWSPMTTGYNINNNLMNDCPQVGITIECNSELSGLSISNNTINGAKNAVFEYLNGTGSGSLGKLTVSNIEGEWINDQAPNFVLTLVDEGIVEADDKDDETGDVSGEDKDDESGDASDDNNKPGCIIPDWIKPNWTKPDWTKPNWTLPDWIKPNWTKPDWTKPNWTKPNWTISDLLKPWQFLPNMNKFNRGK